MCILLLCITFARAADPTSQPVLLDVSAENAAFNATIGKEVVVQGSVSSAVWSASGKVMNIEFKNAGNSRFLTVIFERNRAKIDEGFNGDVGATLTNAKIRIRGTLELYGGEIESMKGRPQLVISNGDQITILDPAATSQR
jgi:hypothetical protein